ncbi:MAG: V-type ATP synthase subunit E family protein [Clostridia bacterium]|nr:V-type ATP synthase subunit E family protein [Clostridia bacterium]
MNGLEKIKQKILTDAKGVCDSLTADAMDKAQKIAEKNLEAAEAEAQAILQRAEAEVARIAENAESACETVHKRAQLEAKSKVIDGWINAAKNKVKTLKADEYFDFIAAVAVRHCSADEGVLLMRAEDIKAMPSGFLDKINGEIKGGGRFSEIKAADIGAGCVISYGDIEENCTVDTLFDDKADEIKDALFAFLK